MTYSEQLRHPLWQLRRIEIISKANGHCEYCGEKFDELEVHHGHYVKGRMAWEYPDEVLYALCRDCHYDIQEFMDKAYYELALRQLHPHHTLAAIKRDIPEHPVLFRHENEG